MAFWFGVQEPKECCKCETPFDDEIEFSAFCKSCNEARKLSDAQIVRAIKENKPFKLIDRYSLFIDSALLIDIDVSPIYDAAAISETFVGCSKDHSPKECEALARLIAANLPRLKELHIQNGSYNDETGSIAAALKVNNHIRTLRLEETPRHIGLIAKALENDVNINEVILINTRCVDDGAKILFESIAKNKSVKEISLRLEDSLNMDAFVAIAEMLKVNTTLETLDFLNSNYGFECWKILAGGLAEAKGLKNFQLRNSTIGNDGLGVILEALKSNTSLKVFEVPLSDQQRCIHVSNFLKANPPLESLSISGFCSFPIGELADGIRANTHLKIFGSDCTTPTGDFKPFFEALKYNKTIENVGLNDSKLNDAALRSLAEVIKVNRSIKSLRFSNCLTQDPETWNMVVDALKHNTTIEDLGGFGPQESWEENTVGAVELAADLIRNNKTIRELRVSGHVDATKMHLLKEALLENDTLKNLWFRDVRTCKEEGLEEKLYEEIFSKNYALNTLYIFKSNDDVEPWRQYCDRNQAYQKEKYEETVLLIHNFARSSYARNLLPNELWCHIFGMLKYPGLNNFRSAAERIFKEQNSNEINDKKRKRSDSQEISDPDALENNKKRRL